MTFALICSSLELTFWRLLPQRKHCGSSEVLASLAHVEDDSQAELENYVRVELNQGCGGDEIGLLLDGPALFCDEDFCCSEEE